MAQSPPSFDGVHPRPHPSPFFERWARRFAAWGIYLILWTLLVVTAPIAMPAAAIYDLAKGTNFHVARAIAFFILYFSWEIVGVIWLGLAWLITMPRLTGAWRAFFRVNFTIQVWWVINLMRLLLGVFSVKLKVEGDNDFRKRPYILFIRHVSATDTLFPPYFAYSQRAHIRFVLKRELLWDPCLEMSFTRLPNYFVRRGAADNDKEIEMVGRLLDDIGENDGVLIYPEGTRFTDAKKARILEKIRETGDEEAYRQADALKHVLPPRPGGPLKLLEKNPGCDALFCTHTGLEGATTFADVLKGGIVGTTIRFKFWRVPFEDIPTDPADRIHWLTEEWKKVDEFVAEHGPKPRKAD